MQLPIGRVIVQVEQFFIHYGVVDLHQMFKECHDRLVGLEEGVERTQLLGQCCITLVSKYGAIVAEILRFIAVEGYKGVVSLVGSREFNSHLTEFLKHTDDIASTFKRVKPLRKVWPC